MSKIQVLDQITIDKIAAGEVIERPASVVKELVENAIDAGASSVTVDIKEGGISLIRIADNGCGIPKEEVRPAFLRHSTSKIRSVDDLLHIRSLGFRGEALSSIAAVAQVELLTKTKEDIFGTRYHIAGGKEESLEEDSAPDGTTFFIRQLFYNVPARRKFLKTAMTEASHVGDLMTRIALSHPEVSFHFINNGQSKIHTSGNGNLKDVIYHIYGREIAGNLLSADYDKNGIRITGFLGAPIISRGNRNFENYFINYRYIKNNMVYKAIEDAYKDFSMQHKFPFVALHIEMNGEEVDVNVHPSKLEIRFHNQQEVYNAIYEAVETGLRGKELIPQITVDAPEAKPSGKAPTRTGTMRAPAAAPIGTGMAKSPAEIPVGSGTAGAPTAAPVVRPEAAQKKVIPPKEERDLDYFMEEMKKRVRAYHEQNSSAEVAGKDSLFKPELQADRIREAVAFYGTAQEKKTQPLNLKAESDMPGQIWPEKPQREHGLTEQDRTAQRQAVQAEPEYRRIEQPRPRQQAQPEESAPRQLDLFEEKFLDRQVQAEYKLIGQVFDTYWLVEYHENLYIIDQHAAHERVLYEKTLSGMKSREFTSQMISPPIILNLTMQEQEIFKRHMERFTRIGFEFEEFGQESYAVRAVPGNLFSIAKKEILMEMIDSLSEEISRNLSPDIIDEKIASMSCKAAVKGKMRLSAAEAEALISELLTLKNPYHCPHGRPTIIAMSKRELEKKFKRIV